MTLTPYFSHDMPLGTLKLHIDIFTRPIKLDLFGMLKRGECCMHVLQNLVFVIICIEKRRTD